MVFIYSPSENTKRLDYIARHFFNNTPETGFEILRNRAVFLQQSGVCINYSDEALNHGLQITPHGLLSEAGVRKISDLEISEWQGLFCFFKREKGDIPFDIFAASFYLLTLYEEYFPKQLDKHGRFSEKESLTYCNGFLETPLIDRWVHLLKEELKKRYPGQIFRQREYHVISTFDIDLPYLFLKKGLIKFVGGSLKDLVKFDWENIMSRFAVHFRRKSDPYMQTILWIDEVQKKAACPYLLFVLMGKRGKYGRSTVYPTPSYFQYLKNLRKVEIGLHPSYDTYMNINLLKKEKNQLEKRLGKTLTATRQHFLRMRNPETFRDLNTVGFKNDFTLMFSQAPGFRSGTAIPYYFYDAEKDELTGLVLHPTITMDTTLISHLHLTPEEALHKIKKLIDECKKSGGDYVSLWHNSNLSGENNPWKKVFIESFHYAISLESDNFAPV
jgi:hypothetical protein